MSSRRAALIDLLPIRRHSRSQEMWPLNLDCKPEDITDANVCGVTQRLKDRGDGGRIRSKNEGAHTAGFERFQSPLKCVSIGVPRSRVIKSLILKNISPRSGTRCNPAVFHPMSSCLYAVVLRSGPGPTWMAREPNASAL